MQKLSYLIQEPKIKTENPELFLLLHGYGSNEADLFSFAVDLPETMLIVSLQAPLPLSFGGFAWYEINFMNAEKFNNIEQANYSQELILHFIEEFSKIHTFNKEKVFLCGFSQGSILSYSLLLNHPEIFKRGILLSGYLDPKIVGQTLSNKDYSDLALYISHGIQDAVIPIEWARNAPKIISDLGIKNDYHEYLSGHGINPQNYRDMMIWLDNNK